MSQEQKQKRQTDLVNNHTGKWEQKKTMTIKYLFKIVRSKDEEVVRVVKEIKKAGVKILREEE